MSQRLIITCILVVLGLSPIGLAQEIRAFSLREAQRAAKDGDIDAAIAGLGGITRFAGMVHDRKNKDIILIGRAHEGSPAVTFDDLVVALRARLIHQAYPFVSIDPTKDTAETGNQAVRFGGAIEDTPFGRDLLACDVVLKRYSLDLLKKTEGVESYLKRYEAKIQSDLITDAGPAEEVEWLDEAQSKKTVDDNRSRGVTEMSSEQSRFWFYVRDEESFIVRVKDVFLIKELKIGVLAEHITDGEQAKSDLPEGSSSQLVDDAFATEFTSGMERIAESHPSLKRLKALFDIVCIAGGIESLGKSRPDIQYLLEAYRVSQTDTPKTYKLVERVGRFKRDEEVVSLVRLSGGIELKDLVIALNDGDTSALKLAVTASRPNERSVTWIVPINQWKMPNDIASAAQQLLVKQTEGRQRRPTKLGFGLTIDHIAFSSDGAGDRNFQGFPPVKPMRNPTPRIPTIRNLEDAATVGGVLLRGAASVEGDGDFAGRLATGNFALVLDDSDSWLHPLAFRKFVTSLWCVYLGKTAPGISIDPIAPGAKKQLVRYIGRVHNTDLARVMRDADYLMKQWAVGTTRPDINGFRSPDEYAAKRGTAYLNILSRFWFVPMNMRFRSTGEGIVFLDGDMTVQTEFVVRGEQDVQADPANEDFARWFTISYGAVSRKYPVYSELYDYAKLVALANYVTDSGVPLLWFVVAHRDLVLTEQSPGTVDALFADSKAMEDIRIEGGVHLASQPRYIMDAEARAAVAEAYERLDGGDTDSGLARPDTTIEDRGPVDERRGRMSIVPQHSASSGVDYRGVRYQTDLSISEDGYRLSPTAFANLRSELQERFLLIAMRPHLKDREYSDGSVRNAQELERTFAAEWKIALDKAEGIVRRLNALSGKAYPDSRSFDEDVVGVLGEETPEVVGPVIRQAARFRQRFDLVRYCSLATASNNGAFGQGWSLLVPYRLEFSAVTESAGQIGRVPAEIYLVNQLQGERETLNLQFDPATGSIIYVSELSSHSLALGLAVMADGGFRLEDRLGCIFEFNALGQMTSMTLSDAHRMEFVRKPLTAFERTPYKLSAVAGAGEVEFQGGQAMAPKQFQITDADGRKHTFTFDNSREYLAWKPTAKDGLFIKLLLMNGDTFHALDRHGATTVFASNGSFEAIVPSKNADCVARLIAGSQHIELVYSVGADGRLFVSEARAYVSGPRDQPNYIVKYTYTADQQLVRSRISLPNGDALAWQTN